MEKRELRIVTLDKYDYGFVVNALNDLRTGKIKGGEATEHIDNVLLKFIDAPAKKVKYKRDEAR